MSEPREGRWLARPMRATRLESDSGPFTALVALVAALACGLSWLWVPDRPWVPLTVMMVVLAVPAIGLAAREAWSLRPLRRDRLLAELPDDGDDFAALVVVGVGGKRLGADRGVVWFADGTMGFVGERCSFLLAAEDVAEFGGTLQNRPARRGIGMPLDAIVLRAAEGRAYVAIRPVDWLGGRTWAFRRRLAAFRQANVPYPGERQWPPLVPFSLPPTPSSSPVANDTKLSTSDRGDEEGASLRDRLEHAVALQDDVDGGALRVGELDQR